MRISEFTNAEEQLGLLRLIIDNTWGAIKQQADAQARQRAVQANAKPKAKAPKKVPYVAPQIQIPKLANQVVNSKQTNPTTTKPAIDRSMEDLKKFQDHLRGEKTKTSQMTQNRDLSQEP